MSGSPIDIYAGETWRQFPLVAKADGSPIESGVSYLLKALTGDNAGKWYRDSDQTWQTLSADANNSMTHQANGSHTIQLTESPFVAGVVYHEHAIDSGGLAVAGTARLLRCVTQLTTAAIQAALTSQGLTEARAGYLDKLNVAGDLANTANASSFKATGFAVPGSPMTLTSDERNAIWNLEDGIETNVTPKQALQRIGAIAAGKVSGAGTDAELFVGMDGETNRVLVQADSKGNRTAVEYDPE